MKKFTFRIALGCLLVFASLQVHAKPENGLGLFAGYSLSTLDSSADNISVDSAGPSFGIDYQFVLKDKISINPFLILSKEEGDFTSSGVAINAKSDITIIGAQVRFWFDNKLGGLFVGGHIAKYEDDLTLEAGGSSASDSGDGIGFGAIIGLEREGGFFVTEQADAVDLDGVDYTSLRAHAGFRFKL